MAPPVHPGEDMLALKISHVALGLGIVACSGASSPGIPPSQEDNSVKVPPFGDTATSPPSRDQDEPDTTVDAPTKKKPAPPPECPAEEEPNNDADQATTFTKCITGQLTAWTDNDYLQITAPDDAEQMVIDHIEPDGAIQYTVSIPGGGSNNFNMSFTDKAPQTKIRPGQAYLFSLKWDNNGQGNVSDTRSYALRVSFQ